MTANRPGAHGSRAVRRYVTRTTFRWPRREASPADVAVRDVLYSLYERRLVRDLAGKPRPRHVGVILDGNRRWAREAGFDDPNEGHHVGARKIEQVLGWCSEQGVEVVTLWLLSTDNLTRPESE